MCTKSNCLINNRFFIERLNIPMGREDTDNGIYGFCEICSVPLPIWRGCSCKTYNYLNGMVDIDYILSCESEKHQFNVYCFICSEFIKMV